ncbi:MAG: hypothetical protein KJ990_06925 [Proteobacteria bacterium]|nr:hypothetical protein [Pseudomonadota bacterium]MBU1650203.1 hypothetical protein [Pseudomonadota bacterium]
MISIKASSIAYRETAGTGLVNANILNQQTIIVKYNPFFTAITPLPINIPALLSRYEQRNMKNKQ